MSEIEVKAKNGRIWFYSNGWVLSCQMAGGNYSDNYHAPIVPDGQYEFAQSRTAEIAIWAEGTGSRRMLQFEGGDTVLGYVSWTEIMSYWLPLVRETPADLDAQSVAELEAARANSRAKSEARS